MTDADRDAFRATMDVSRETLARLDTLVARLTHWSKAINLVAPRSLPQVWTRHILDCAQLWDHAPAAATRWVDLGSGAGFPGLVIAAMAAERRPSLSMALVESDARKCAFLADAARAMDLRVTVLRQRAEDEPFTPADVVSARALAPLPALLALVRPWLADGGVALLLKGRDCGAELTDAARHWHTRTASIPSVSDPAGVVLAVSEIRRVAC